MTNDIVSLDNFVPYNGNQRVFVGNGNSLPISQIGSISSIVASKSLSLSDVLLVSDITKNLLSISKLTLENIRLVTFSSIGFTIQDLAIRAVVGVNQCEKGLYILDHAHANFLSTFSLCTSCATSDIWHAQLRHLSSRIDSFLNKHGDITISNKCKFDSIPCFGCQLEKNHRLPVSNLDQRCSSFCERIHCDLWGPSPITYPSGYRYYCLFIDNFSRFS